MKIYMNANIKKTQIFHKRSQKVILKFQNHLFLQAVFCLTPKSFKTFSKTSTLWTHKSFRKWSIASKVIQGFIRPLLCKIILAHLFMDRFYMNICMNANISFWRLKFCLKLSMTWNVTFMLLRNFVIFLL